MIQWIKRLYLLLSPILKKLITQFTTTNPITKEVSAKEKS